MLSDLWGQVKSIVGLIGLLALVFCIGWFVRGCSPNNDLLNLQLSNAKTVEELAQTRNKVSSLTGFLEKAGGEKEQLVDLVASLKQRKPEVRYIVQEKIVLQGESETVVELPPNYTFKLDGRVPVASFETLQEKYQFKTYDLKIKTDVVISRNKTVAATTVESSAEPGVEYPVKSEIKVTQVDDKRKVFEPHIGLGFSGLGPDWDLGASVYTTLIHPGKNVDLLGIRVTGTSKDVLLGLDPVGYNLGGHLPIFTDLWISAGISVGLKLKPQATLTLGSKL